MVSTPEMVAQETVEADERQEQALRLRQRRVRRVQGLAMAAALAAAFSALLIGAYGLATDNPPLVIWTVVPWVVAVINVVARWRAPVRLRTARALILWSVTGGLAVSVLTFGVQLGGMTLFLAWTVVLGALLYGPTMVLVTTGVSVLIVVLTGALQLLGVVPIVTMSPGFALWGNLVLGVVYPLTMAGTVKLYADYLQDVLNETAGRIQQHVDSVVASAQQQAAAAQQQAAAVQEISATAEELSRTAEQLSAHSGQLDEIATHSYESVHQGGQMVSDILTDIHAFAEHMRELVSQALRLSEHSQRIGEIMDMVNRISDETHLIALNAAIEAASAGEHGHRFSVIAAEIRRLAEHAIKSGDQIKNMVRDLQSTVNMAVMTLEDQVKRVERMEEKARATQHHLGDMIESVEMTRAEARELADMATDIRDVSRQLAMSLHEMSQVAESIAESSQSGLETAQELAEVARTVAQSGV